MDSSIINKPDVPPSIVVARRSHWDRPAHFIGSNRCRFGLADVVNSHIVSTVGDYYPEGSGIREPIGCGRYFETMVFRDSGKRCEEAGCECGGLPEPADWDPIDFEGYLEIEDAREGHRRMVETWQKSGGAK